MLDDASALERMARIRSRMCSFKYRAETFRFDSVGSDFGLGNFLPGASRDITRLKGVVPSEKM